MNYRHAFHAGNFADCMKHALLMTLMGLMLRKTTPLFVLDTHAGQGTYDLLAEAQRTGEWHEGIARLIPPPAALAPYVAIVERLGLYPGSPLLLRSRMRPGDQLACCELHPEDAATLRRRFRGDPLVAVHQRDGYEAVGALLPPTPRRGLVFIDPPFETVDEAARVIAAFQTAAQRFNHGVCVAWYPIKHRSPVTALHLAMQQTGLRDLVAAELWLREPTDPARLNGCGLLLRNAPFGFAEEAAPILAALRDTLGDRPERGAGGGAGGGAGWNIVRLADE